MTTKSHYDLKKQAGGATAGSKKTITDADYRMRDIGSAEDTEKNIIDITPPEFKAKPVVSKPAAKGE